MTRSEQHRPEIVVGLVATPPDHPARVAERLSAELADRLAERVDADVRWTVRDGWGDVAPRRDGGAEALLDDLARRRTDDGWDVAICLTDLPLHAEGCRSSRRPPPGTGSRWCPCPRWDCASCERFALPFRTWWAGYSRTLPTSGCRRPAGRRPS